MVDIGGLAAGQYSVLQINGAATFSGGNIEFDFIGGYKPSAGNFWDFLFADTITDWNLLSFSLVGLDESVWQIGKLSEIGHERLRLQITGPPVHSTVPLPPTFWLLGSGLLDLVGWRMFRKG